jgi:hypothetical protein
LAVPEAVVHGEQLEFVQGKRGCAGQSTEL